MTKQLERAAPAERTHITPRSNRLRGLLLVSSPYLLAAVITGAVALYTYTPWRLDGAIPFPSGDSLAFHSWVKTIIEFGWYEYNPLLSAPYGQNNHEYVLTDDLLFFVIGKVLAPLVGGFSGGVLLYVLIGFPLAAASAVAVARYFGVSRSASVFVGVGFALLPDHFLRVTGHYSLTSQWAVPVGVLAALSVVRMPGRLRPTVGVRVAILLGCVAIALTNVYYAVFAAVLVVGCAVVAAVAEKAWVRIRWAALCIAALIGPVALAALVDFVRIPSPLGHASAISSRSPGESEIWGGRITAMLLPSPDHRFRVFRAIREHYLHIFGNPAENPVLGLVASAGFLLLVVWSLAILMRDASPKHPQLSVLAILNWLAVLIFTVGGIGSIWSLLFNGGGIRVWSRAHLVIAVIALTAVAAVVDWIRPAGRKVTVVASLIVIVLIDQTSPRDRPDIADSKKLASEVADLTSNIAAVSGEDAAVFQMPIIGFPVPDRELGRASPYDGFLPYLYDDNDLRWSFGGHQGDPRADWQQSLPSDVLREKAAALSAAGFDGILVDTRVPTGKETANELNAMLGPGIMSRSSRWRYFSLSLGLDCREPEIEEVVRATLQPPVIYAGENFEPRTMTWISRSDQSTLRMLTLHKEGWPRVTLSLSIASEKNNSSFQVTFPDGSRTSYQPGDQAIRWTGQLSGPEATINVRRISGRGNYALGEHSARVVLSSGASRCIASFAPRIV
jgi:hypothetical protein